MYFVVSNKAGNARKPTTKATKLVTLGESDWSACEFDQMFAADAVGVLVRGVLPVVVAGVTVDVFASPFPTIRTLIVPSKWVSWEDRSVFPFCRNSKKFYSFESDNTTQTVIGDVYKTEQLTLVELTKLLLVFL